MYICDKTIYGAVRLYGGTIRDYRPPTSDVRRATSPSVSFQDKLNLC